MTKEERCVGATPSPGIRRDVPPWALVFVLGLEAALLGTAQVGRDLRTVDDLREAEVAREMAADGNFVVPHLAGLPYVEKPPGFPAIVAVLFRLLGGPSVLGARLVSAGFALAALVAVFLLGRRALGVGGGVLASTFLAFSPLFVTVSHQILLDNALLAAMAWGFHFAWIALTQVDPRMKRTGYAAASFFLGTAFLVKGLTGPSLAATGMLVYLVLSGRWSELRAAFHPFAVAAFLAPPLLWLVPYLRTASPELVEEFFVKNHFGRFLWAYDSHPRPVYFHLETIWYKLGPGAAFLPFAALAAWLDRRKQEGRSGLIFLSFSAGPFILLSISKAKDAIYVLPAYPALTLLAAGWCVRAFSARPSAGLTGTVTAVASAGAATAAVITTFALGGPTVGGVLAALGVGTLLIVLVASIVKGRLSTSASTAAALWVGSALLYLTGPIAEHEESRLEWKAALPVVLRAAGGKDLILYRPDDEIRGAYGFYRRKTATEIDDPALFIRRLNQEKDTLGIVLWPGPSLPDELVTEAARANMAVDVRLRVTYYRKNLLLVSSRDSQD